MKTKNFFKVEIRIRWEKDKKKKPTFYSFYNWKISLCFDKVPTEQQVIKAIEDDFRICKQEHEWTEKKYNISKYTKGDPFPQYREILVKEGINAMKVGGLPKCPKNWKHIGMIMHFKDRYTISVGIRSMYLV